MWRMGPHLGDVVSDQGVFTKAFDITRPTQSLVDNNDDHDY